MPRVRLGVVVWYTQRTHHLAQNASSDPLRRKFSTRTLAHVRWRQPAPKGCLPCFIDLPPLAVDVSVRDDVSRTP